MFRVAAVVSAVVAAVVATVVAAIVAEIVAAVVESVERSLPTPEIRGLNPTTCRFYLYKNQSASCIDKQKSQESSKKLYLSCWQLSKRKVSRLIGVGPS